MARLIVRRLLALPPLLLIVSLIVFSLATLVPGSAASAILGESATLEQIQAVRQELGLDRPWIVRYGTWLWDAIQGDLGTSLFTSYAVSEAIVDRLPVTISLIGLSLAVALALGVPLGVASGTHPNNWVDRIVTTGASFGVAVPNFWLGLLLVLFFSIRHAWLPSTGYVPITQSPGEWFLHMTLPAVTLGVAGAAEVARQTRASVASVMGRDYIRTARAKGMTEPVVVGKHSLKNAMIPVVTVTGLQVARLLGIGAIVEQIFGLPGIGRLAIEAAASRDVPVLQGVVLTAALIVLLTSLLVDVVYGLLDPRVKTS